MLHFYLSDVRFPGGKKMIYTEGLSVHERVVRTRRLLVLLSLNTESGGGGGGGVHQTYH